MPGALNVSASTLLCEIVSRFGFASACKYCNNRLTRHSRSGKHGRLDQSSKRNVTRSLFHKYTFYLVSNNMDHGRQFKQMRLCADFHAGPSKEYLIFFLFNLKDPNEEEEEETPAQSIAQLMVWILSVIMLPILSQVCSSYF